MSVPAITSVPTALSIGIGPSNAKTITDHVAVLRSHAWLADHDIAGALPLPATAFLELALAAAARAGCDLIEDLTLEIPLPLPATGGVDVQVSVAAADDALATTRDRAELADLSGRLHRAEAAEIARREVERAASRSRVDAAAAGPDLLETDLAKWQFRQTT